MLGGVKKPEITEDQIAKNLTKLFSWSGSSAYCYYFYELPKPLDLKSLYAASAAEMQNTQVQKKPYAVDNPNATIKLKMPAELVSIPNNDGMCVVLDGFGQPVPIPAARVCAASFANGFVARLILGEYLNAWQKAGVHVDVNTLNFVSSVAVQPIPDDFVKLASYQDMQGTPPAAVLNAATFDAGLSKLLKSRSLQAAGFLWGWKAASELDSFRGTNQQDILDAAWTLVRGRFTTREMGQISAYSLNYLIGYTKVANIRLASNTAATEDSSKILENLANDPNIGVAKSILSSLHGAFLAEYSALAANEQLPRDKKVKALQAYFSFIEGFQEGTAKASDELFEDVYMLGYGIGYKDGFRDGYAQGYAAGYRDGYAIGYKTAWTEANKVIDGLQAQLAAVDKDLSLVRDQLATTQKELDDARQHESSDDGFDKFLDGVSKAAKVAGTVISVFGGLF